MKKYIKNREFNKILIETNNRLINGEEVEQSIIDIMDTNRNLTSWNNLLSAGGISQEFFKIKPELKNSFSLVENFSNISEQFLIDNSKLISEWYYVIISKPDLSNEFIKNVILPFNNRYPLSVLDHSMNIIDVDMIEYIKNSELYNLSDSSLSIKLSANPYLNDSIVDKYIMKDHYYLIKCMDNFSKEFIKSRIKYFRIDYIIDNANKIGIEGINQLLIGRVESTKDMKEILTRVSFKLDELEQILNKEYDFLFRYKVIKNIIRFQNIDSYLIDTYIMNTGYDLSENIIPDIIKFQHISNDFIIKYNELFSRNDWVTLCKYYKINNEIIDKFRSKLILIDILMYQDIRDIEINSKSVNFFSDFENNMRYMDDRKKIEILKNNDAFNVVEKDGSYKVYSYKIVNRDLRSITYPCNLIYEMGSVIKSNNCDCNMLNNASFGINSWNKTKLIHVLNNNRYRNDFTKIVKLESDISDIGCMVTSDIFIIRTFKSTVVDIYDIDSADIAEI